MTSKTNRPAVPLNSDIADLERLIRRLAIKAPGYPFDLALTARLSGQLDKRANEAVNAALRPLDLTHVLYQSMMIIFGGEDGSIAPSELAQMTGERPNNITHICNELVARGLITRLPAANDRRKVLISLTPAGRRLLAKAQPLVWDRWRQRFDGFSSSELNALSLLCRRQIDNIHKSTAG